MKKVLTAILLVAMIASIASVAAFADYTPLTITAGAVEVEEGATEAVVPVTVENANALGISSITVTVKAAGASITAVDAADLASGNWIVSDLPAEDATVMWADIAKGTHDAKVTFANVKVAIPADAKAGDKIDVQVIVSEDADNYVSFDEVDDDTVGYGATGVAGSITIVEKAAPADSESKPADSESKPADESKADESKVDESKADETKADDKKDDGKKAPQTGDVAIIVVAAMIVALGTAIVVKKVNVK
jgi:hypothetical protein